MAYIAQVPEVAPYNFNLLSGTAVNTEAVQANLARFAAGESIRLDGGTEIACLSIGEEDTNLLLGGIALLNNYGTVALPGDSQASIPALDRYLELPSTARLIVDNVHTTLREIVRQDAERSDLYPPNINVGRVDLGLFYHHLGWHPDGCHTFRSEQERLGSLLGHGIFRYTLSIGTPGTDLLKGLLNPGDIIDDLYLREDLDIGGPGSQLQIVEHASALVVRFLSDYDIHRSHPMQDNELLPRYFETASAALKL